MLRCAQLGDSRRKLAVKNSASTFLSEPAREVPVVGEYDLCVIGGSCTGVFAAVRAARLGLSVALVERNILFGGMAAAAQVNEWHSLHDLSGRRQVIGGLTAEVLAQLRGRNAVRDGQRREGASFRFNSAELALLLDELVREHGIRPFLQAICVGGLCEDGRVVAALLEDKSGRRAIRARFFIDASGDGDLLRRTGFRARRDPQLQPASYQVLASGLGTPQQASALWRRARTRASEFGYSLENGTPWFSEYPSGGAVLNVFGARMNGVDASDADSLTRAILEGRRRQTAMLEMLRAAGAENLNVVGLAHALGVRETWHACCLQALTGDELLAGCPFSDAIAQGTYPVDVHSVEGTLLRYLDGREFLVRPDGSEIERHWRPADAEIPSFYQIPFRSLIPQDARNFLIAGRLIDADREAFGAVRVMVTMNQTGEAAGVAAALCLQEDCPPENLSSELLRRTLVEGGSLLNI